MLMRYIIIGLLCNAFSTYRLPKGHKLYIDGHGMNEEFVRLFSLEEPRIINENPNEHTKLYDVPIVIGNRNGNNTLLPFEMALKNQVGEAECAIFNFIYRHYSSNMRKFNKTSKYLIVTVDTDAMWYALLWLMKCHMFIEGEKPQIVIDMTVRRGSKVYTKIVDVNALYDVFLDKFNGDHTKISGLVFAAVAAGGDYTPDSPACVTMTHNVKAYLDHHELIGAPIKNGARDLAYDARFFHLITAAAFFTAYPKKFAQRGVHEFSQIKSLDHVRHILNTTVIAKKYALYTERGCELPEDPRTFHLIVDNLARRVPSVDEMRHRTLAWLGCVKIMINVGCSQLYLPHPLEYGYKLRKGNALKRSNIVMCASKDWDGLEARREAMWGPLPLEEGRGVSM